MFKYFVFSLLGVHCALFSGFDLEKDVPEIPREALKQLAGGAKISDVGIESDNGATFYRAKWNNGTPYEATVTGDGTVSIFVEQVPKDRVPFTVRRTVESLMSKATVVEFEKETFLVYRIRATVDGKKYEALISPSGKMVGINELINP